MEQVRTHESRYNTSFGNSASWMVRDSIPKLRAGCSSHPGGTTERRSALEQVTENHHAVIFPARRLASNGLDAWSQVLEASYEGMVAKDHTSPLRRRAHPQVAQGEGPEVPRG